MRHRLATTTWGHAAAILLFATSSLLTASVAQAAEAINNCPPVEINPTIRDRLEEARGKYAGNCLSCEGPECSFKTSLNNNETRICQTLYCQPIKLKKRSVQPFNGSVSGLVEYTYSINGRGQISNIELLTDVSNEERRQVIAHIRSGMKGRRFKPIVVDGERLQLNGLYGALEIVNR